MRIRKWLRKLLKIFALVWFSRLIYVQLEVRQVRNSELQCELVLFLKPLWGHLLRKYEGTAGLVLECERI